MIKMITSIAGEEIFVGDCHPARARILVKKELASWKDGKLLLHVLGVHDALLKGNPDVARGPLDDENVSKQEMERRLAWFRSLMVKSSKVFAQMARPLPSLEEAEAWEELQATSLLGAEVVATPPAPGEPLSWEEARPYYEDTVLEDIIFEMRDLWERPHVDWLQGGPTLQVVGSDPLLTSSTSQDMQLELGKIFSGGTQEEVHVRCVWPEIAPPLTRAEYEAIWRQDREKTHCLLEDMGTPMVPVAHLTQVRYLWAH